MRGGFASVVAALVGVLLVGGCGSREGGGGGRDGGTSTSAGDPDASVVLQPRARIAEARTRQALRAFDLDAGTLRFAPGAPQVSQWMPGDVVVSEPCPGAPAGFLRRIVSSATDGTDLILNTTQAALSDVIENGGAEGSFDLQPVAPGKAGLPAARSPALGLDDEHDFDIEYPTPDHPDDNFTLSAKGHEKVAAGVKLRVNIDGACAFDGDPCFEFAATADVANDFDIDITATGHKEWNQSFPIADQTFDPIVLWIGPVPVVFIPHIDSHLDMDESVEARVHVVASGNGPDFQLAVHWDSAHGFSADKSIKAPGMSGTADFSGQATAHASLPVRFRLMLYDVAGVEARVTPELTAHLQIPARPVWYLDGRFVAAIGVDAQLPIIGDLGSADYTLFDESFRVGQASNTPPSPNIVLPYAGQSYDIAAPDYANVRLVAHAFDDEDGDNCCTFRWALTDGTPLVDGNDIDFTFPRSGHYDVVAIATDSDGASQASPPVGVDIVESPPGARLVLPSWACSDHLYVGYPVRIRGEDTRPPLSQLPYDCHFASTALLTGGKDTQFPIAVPPEQVTQAGCDIDVRFAFADYRDIHLLV